MHRLGLCMMQSLNMAFEYGDFWNIDIYPTFHSHGSVATCLMYGGIFKYGFIIHLLQSLLLILH